MPQKTEILPGVGEVILVKRRGAKNIRLSITSTGKVRVSLPLWAPYSVGLKFARSRTDWIKKHLAGYAKTALKHGHLIGKSHRLEFTQTDRATVYTRVTQTSVIIKSSLPLSEPSVQEKAYAASERALAAQSKALLPQRLNQLAERYGYNYRSVTIKKLTSRWGSCTSNKDISLSYYLIQLPWHLIDYVLLHELAHTRYLNHSADFWGEMKRVSPNVKVYRREIKKHKPGLQIENLWHN